MGGVVVDTAALARLATGPAVVEYVARKSAEVAVAARAGAPVRSGHLAMSIGVERRPGPGVAFAIGSRLEYALYIERRSPYLRPALEVLS